MGYKKTSDPKKVHRQRWAIANAKKKATSNTNGCVKVNVKNHYDKTDRHPHIILENIDNKYVSVGLTTKPKKGKKGGNNYLLEKSPIPLKKGKKSYIRRQGTVAPMSEYTNLRKGVLTIDDYDRVKLYGERAKQKYLEKESIKK